MAFVYNASLSLFQEKAAIHAHYFAEYSSRLVKTTDVSVVEVYWLNPSNKCTAEAKTSKS